MTTASTIPLASLVRGLPLNVPIDALDIPIRGVTDDSRDVEPGTLFIARPGTTTDGLAHVPSALERGAVAIVTEADAPVQGDAMQVFARDVAEVGAVLAQRFHGNPSHHLGLVGVTGTNGKTTVAHLVHQLVARTRGQCGLMGTIAIDDGRAVKTASLTTPGAPAIARSLAAMVANGCPAAVMEVSSHALDQRRVGGLDFRVGIFTNLSGDHLDYHGSMKSYAEAKARLFHDLGPDALAVINADDAYAATMTALTEASIVRCSLDGRGDARAIIEGTDAAGTLVAFEGPFGRIAGRLPLVGRHNAMNTLQALVAAHAVGIAPEALESALPHLHAPAGRLERVPGGVPVFVDYAHTDDALARALDAVRPLVPGGGELRVVFGCGGDRDRTKRPRMAEVACAGADRIIVTSDNPRTEDPVAIIEDVLAGVPAPRRSAVVAEPDRAAAIAEAVATARPVDLVLIAGKGHEDYQIIGTQRRAFDDREVAAAALAAREGA